MSVIGEILSADQFGCGTDSMKRRKIGALPVVSPHQERIHQPIPGLWKMIAALIIRFWFSKKCGILGVFWEPPA